MAIKTLIEPVNEPVTLAEAKTWLRLEQNAEDDLLTTLITTARLRSETVSNLAMITRSLQEDMEIKPGSRIINLSIGPVQSILELAQKNKDGSLSILDSGEYVFDAAHRRIVLGTMGATSSFQVQYVAGYGDQTTDIPAPLKTAILLQMAWLFEHRDETEKFIPYAAQSLLAPYGRLHL